MKHRLILLALALLLPAASVSAQVSFGEASRFNQGWKFILDDAADAASADFDDQRWRPVTLPHDWSVESYPSPDLASCTGYLPGGIGWYRKHFTIEDAAARHYIYFEGVYNRSEVYLNGHLLGKRPSGFASFMYDMTPYLREGDNVLAVRVDHSRSADARWYTGSGIYRNVWLVAAPDTHLAQWGSAYRLVSATAKKALVEVDVEVEKTKAVKGRLSAEVRIVDAKGTTLSRKSLRIKDNGAGTVKQTVTLSLASPRFWSLEDPYQYEVVTDLLLDGKRIDGSVVKAGLRTLTFDPDHGFALNGKWMKVKGVCLHHDAGVLGAAVPREVWKHRILELKKMGANGIRLAHNPHSPDLYELCDELGMLVMDEAFDEWEFPKRKWLKGWNQGTPGFQGIDDFFEEWGERDITDMVRRDRNHASVFLWSIGNEVDYPNDPYSHPILDGDGSAISQPMYGGYKPDAPNAERIGLIAKRLADCVRAVDTSRPVTGALAGVVMSNETIYPDVVDVVGYNYTESRYDIDHERYPKRVIYGSETSRGLSSWTDVRDREHIFGHFIWTGTDYLGESTTWPARGMYTGLLDLASFRKPAAQSRAAMWSEEPFTYVGTSAVPRRVPGRRAFFGGDPWEVWNYEDGQQVRVVCYTNAPFARLKLNGKPVGEMKAADSRLGAMMWEIPYEAGELVAEGCDESGKVLSSHAIRTTGRPCAISAKPLGGNAVCADQGTALVEIHILDDAGKEVNLADNEITCTVEGPARLLGLESGNNTDMTLPVSNRRRVFMGRLMAYVQATGEEGTVTVRFTSPLLQSCTVELKSTK